MKNTKCSICGSLRTTKSPSGQHLICLDCQRIILRKLPLTPQEEREDLPAMRSRKAAAASGAAD